MHLRIRRRQFIQGMTAVPYTCHKASYTFNKYNEYVIKLELHGCDLYTPVLGPLDLPVCCPTTFTRRKIKSRHCFYRLPSDQYAVDVSFQHFDSEEAQWDTWSTFCTLKLPKSDLKYFLHTLLQGCIQKDTIDRFMIKQIDKTVLRTN